MKPKRVRISLLLSAAAVMLALMAGGYHYINNGYQAQETALAALASGPEIRVSTRDDMVIFMPEEPSAGLIFYPGGKVDHLAYAPLMRGLAEEGIACALLEMPLDLAVLDMDAAEKARENIPEIDTWYLAGHSLGGAMAAAYAAGCPEEYAGLVLLAAYSTKDLSCSDMKVLSLYGTEDRVLNMEQYFSCRSNLPADTVEAVLEGGNHAQFGSYGPQEGDGEASVTVQEQLAWSVTAISDFILNI